MHVKKVQFFSCVPAKRDVIYLFFFEERWTDFVRFFRIPKTFSNSFENGLNESGRLAFSCLWCPPISCFHIIDFGFFLRIRRAFRCYRSRLFPLLLSECDSKRKTKLSAIYCTRCFFFKYKLAKTFFAKVVFHETWEELQHGALYVYTFSFTFFDYSLIHCGCSRTPKI